ncbi:hypothetical protein AMTRI_Chr04g248040 [Amborella trichopoda]
MCSVLLKATNFLSNHLLLVIQTALSCDSQFCFQLFLCSFKLVLNEIISNLCFKLNQLKFSRESESHQISNQKRLASWLLPYDP